MSNNSKKRPYRERREREIRETIPERIPKKHRGGSDSNGYTDQRGDGAVLEEELLDPVAEARKALEMFEEVSGETIVHIIPKKDTTTKAEVGQRYDEHMYPNNEADSGQTPSTHKNMNGSITKMIREKKKLEGGLKYASSNEERKGEKAREKKEDEEKARQKKRTEVGEARRRKFRPKIAGLQDSNCLL
jgi:hypothetical protein